MLDLSKSKTIIIVFLIILSSFIIIFLTEQNNKSNNSSEDSKEFQYLGKNKNEMSDQQPTNEKTREGLSRQHSHIENMVNGGSWLDSFEDDSDIDWSKSNNVNLRDGNIKINYTHYLDDYTIALWHFDEPSGIVVVDDTVYKNNGTIYNGASRVKGKFGKCLKFDGTDDRVDVLDSPSLSIKGEITISAWVNFTKLPGSGKMYAIVKKRVQADDSYQMFIDSKGAVGCAIDPGTVSWVYANTSLNDGKWHFIAMTWDQSKIRLYNDGKLDVTPVSKTGSMADTSRKIAMGYHTELIDPGKWNYYDGLLDEVRISKIAYSSIEIKNIYENYIYKCPTKGNLTTAQINLPLNMQWDSLIINKTQLDDQFINITILNGSNNEPISNSPKYIDEGEFDISYINSSKYPSIKLSAEFRGFFTSSPVLYYWGVSWNASSAWRDTLFGGLKSLVNDLNPGDGAVWLNTSFTKWLKYSNNPILKIGSNSSWDNKGVEKPCVIYNNTGYMMWYTGVDLGDKWEIGLAMSSDGLSWIKYGGNPVLTTGSGSVWDNSRVGRPTVLFDGKIYKMWYQGMSTSGVVKIGYATSSDGINWNKYANNPILNIGSSGSWDDARVKAPNILYDDNVYKMWYTGDSSTNIHKIGYATSYDGINWTKFANNPILTGPTNPSTGVENLYVMHFYDRYLGWYHNDVGGSGDIDHALSRDGISWVKYQNNPVISQGPPGSWDSVLVGSPKVMANDNHYWMYYVGWDNLNKQIGLAKSKFATTGTVESEKISIQNPNFYNKLIINKTEPSGTFINITVLNGYTDNPIPNYENLSSSVIDLTGISPNDFPAIKLRAEFESLGFNTPNLYDWSVTWDRNVTLRIQDIIAKNKVNRTHLVRIKVNLTSNMEAEDKLNLMVHYRSPSDLYWESDYLSTPQYVTDHWECLFSLPADAELGYYSFNISCNDSHGNYKKSIKTDLIEVINNKPTPPTVTIMPDIPVTLDNLTVHASGSFDIEANLLPEIEIEYWIYWYKNDFHLPQFDNFTQIPYDQTVKNEGWKCVVFPFDGDELGAPGSGEVTIQNSPPVLVMDFSELLMFEDKPVILIEKLDDIFYDADNDTLVYSSQGWKNITVEIIQLNGTIKLIPTKDWFGTEFITFYANDTFSIPAIEVVEIYVSPVNDLPKIVQVGNRYTMPGYPELDFIVYQDHWLNLTIEVEDMDGDLERGNIIYFMNLTTRGNLYLENNQVHFNPSNADVGTHYINISITDGNETPIEYISQHIRIIVQNVNDPPIVLIISPLEGSEFFKDENITFSCIASDIDLLIPGSSEKLTFQWTTNISKFGILGTDRDLENLSLDPGYYNVSVTVSDSSQTTASDYLHISIKEKTKPPDHKPSGKKTSESYWWVWIILIIIIIIIILLVIFLLIKKKKEEERAMLALEGATAPGVLLPDATYLPTSGVLSSSVGTQMGATQTAPTMATVPSQELLQPGLVSTAIPSAQLPPAQPTPAPETQAQTPPALDVELSSQEKLNLLEERLIRGEISEETYLNLKDRIEFEAKQYGPAPQLPPAEAQVEVAPGQPQPPVVPEPTVYEPVQETVPPVEVEEPPTAEQPEEHPEPELPSDLPPEAYLALEPQPAPQPKVPLPQPISRPQPTPQPQVAPQLQVPPQPTPQPQPQQLTPQPTLQPQPQPPTQQPRVQPQPTQKPVESKPEQPQPQQKPKAETEEEQNET